MSAILPVAHVGAGTQSPARAPIEKTVRAATPSAAGAAAAAPVKHAEPIRYYGGIEGMNAANLIVALQAAGTVSGGYSAQAIETGGTPPPTIVDSEA